MGQAQARGDVGAVAQPKVARRLAVVDEDVGVGVEGVEPAEIDVDVAGHPGLDPDELERLEAGVGEPTVETVAVLAEALGVRPVELVRDDADPAQLVGELLARVSPEQRKEMIAAIEATLGARAKSKT